MQELYICVDDKSKDGYALISDKAYFGINGLSFKTEWVKDDMQKHQYIKNLYLTNSRGFDFATRYD